MNDYLVTCINKPHRSSAHEHITHIGNITNQPAQRWRMTREKAIQLIETEQSRFHTIDQSTGKKCYVGVVREPGKAPYLRTHADGTWNNNLLAQQECDGSCSLVG